MSGIDQTPQDLASMGVTFLEKIDSYHYGQRFEVTSYRVRLPNGDETTFYVRDGNAYAVVIPVRADGSFVMVKQYRVGAKQITIEFPMGEVSGKTVEEAASIELKEETGYTAGSINSIGSFHISPGWSTQEGHVFVATELSEGTATPETYEYVTSMVVTEEELDTMISEGMIIDASTRVAFDLYRRSRTSDKTPSDSSPELPTDER